MKHAALQALAEKWPDLATLELLEEQAPMFKEDWIRRKLEESIETLREKSRS